MSTYLPSDFEHLYQATVKNLSKYVFFKVAQISDAEDIVQTVYTKFYAHLLKKGKVVDNLEAYLTQMANHELSRYYQSNAQAPQLLEEASWNSVESDEDVELDVFNRFEAQKIRQALKQLDALDERIVVAKIRFDLSFKEIGSRMEMAESSVKTRYYRALKSLKTWLES